MKKNNLINKFLILFLSIFILLSCWEEFDKKEVKEKTKIENNIKLPNWTEEKNNNELNKKEDIKKTDLIKKEQNWEDSEEESFEEEGNFEEEESFEEDMKDDELENDFSNDENKKLEDKKWQKNKSKFSCENHYSELLNKHKADFSECNFSKNDIWACSWKNSDNWKVNLVIVFDDSWSMWVTIWGEKMIDIAKKSVVNYINKIDLDETNIGFVLYWHRGSSWRKLKRLSCYWVEEVMKLWDKNKEKTLNRIKDLKANWWTPIDRSLKKAKKMINSYAKQKDKNIILLISDGKESCQWNPIETAKNISDWKFEIKIDVIWFNVEWETKNELLNISNNWGWKYFDVKNELEFEKTFNNVKTFLKVMECWANKAAQELEQWVKAINTYFTCNYKIKEEEALIFTAMDEKCEDYIEEKLEERHNKLEKDFKKLKKDWEKILKNFYEHMKDIQEKIKK